MPYGRTIKTGLARILQLVGTKTLQGRWRDSCAVFAFHRISGSDCPTGFPSSTQSIPEPLFEDFAALIREEYNPLSYPEFEEHLTKRRPFPRRSCLLTFDDGWRDNFEHAWPILKKYNLPATVFLPTSFIGTRRRFWQDELYAAFQALREKRKRGRFFLEAHELSGIVYDLLEDPYDRVHHYTREAIDCLKGMDVESAARLFDSIIRNDFGDNRPSSAPRAFLSQEEVAEMAAGGISFGSHSVNHRILPGLAEKELRLEVAQSREDVTALTGTAFTIDYGTVDPASDRYVLRRIDMTARMLSLSDERFSRALFALETMPSMLAVKHRRQSTTRPMVKKTKQPIRLLFLIDEMQGEAGTEKQIVNLIRRLPPDKYKLYLACFVVSDWLRSLDLPCRIYDLNAPSFWLASAHTNILRFTQFLRREQIDIIQTFFRAAHLVGSISGFLAGVPRIITSRRNFGHALTTRRKWTMKVINRFAHRILANSFSVKRRTVELEGAIPRQIEVIYNGVNLAPFRTSPPADYLCKADLGITEDQPIVGIVANLRPVKGVRYFIEAAKIVSKSYPWAQFVVLGYGELIDELKQQAAQLGISGKVHFLGCLPQVIDHLRLFDVAVLSSLSEGFSNAILEYMAAGLPVVATDVGSNWEAIEDGVTGFLARAQDPGDIADKIIDLLSNPERRKKMGLAGRERVERDFSIERMVERHDEYYHHVLATMYREPRSWR